MTEDVTPLDESLEDARRLAVHLEQELSEIRRLVSTYMALSPSPLRSELGTRLRQWARTGELPTSTAAADSDAPTGGGGT